MAVGNSLGYILQDREKGSWVICLGHFFSILVLLMCLRLFEVIKKWRKQRSYEPENACTAEIPWRDT